MILVRWILLPLSSVMLFWPFHQSPTPPPPPPQVSSVLEGTRLFQRACLSCHGPHGDGEGLVLLPNGQAAPALTNLSAESLAIPRLEAVIGHGEAAMPGWSAVMTSQQIKSLALYVASLNSSAN